MEDVGEVGHYQGGFIFICRILSHAGTARKLLGNGDKGGGGVNKARKDTTSSTAYGAAA